MSGLSKIFIAIAYFFGLFVAGAIIGFLVIQRGERQAEFEASQKVYHYMDRAREICGSRLEYFEATTSMVRAGCSTTN